MDERDQKIREMEQQLEEMRQEVGALRDRPPRLPYGAGPSRPGMGTFRYDQRPAPLPKARPLCIALIIAGSLAALAALATVMLFLVFTVINTVDKESTVLAEEMLQAIVDQDGDRAYALAYPGALEREAFDQSFEQMCAAWYAGGGGNAFELKRTSWSMNSSGGTTQYTSRYEIASGEARFTFKLTRVTEGSCTGITGAQISPTLP